MDTDENSLLFRHWNHLLDEVLVVVPDFLFRINAAVGERTLKLLVSPTSFGRGQIEGAGARATASSFRRRAPDAVAHVRVGGVVDPRLAKIAQKILVQLNFLVAAREVERDLLH